MNLLVSQSDFHFIQFPNPKTAQWFETLCWTEFRALSKLSLFYHQKMIKTTYIFLKSTQEI